MDVSTVSSRMDYTPVVLGSVAGLGIALALMVLAAFTVVQAGAADRARALRRMAPTVSLFAVVSAVFGAVAGSTGVEPVSQSEQRAAIASSLSTSYGLHTLALPDGVCLETDAAGPSRSGDYTHSSGFGSMVWSVTDATTCHVELFDSDGEHMNPGRNR